MHPTPATAVADTFIACDRVSDAIEMYAAARATDSLLVIGKAARDAGNLHLAADAFRCADTGEELLTTADRAFQRGWDRLGVDLCYDAAMAGAILPSEYRAKVRETAWHLLEPTVKIVHRGSDIQTASRAFELMREELSEDQLAALLRQADESWTQGRHAEACWLLRGVGRTPTEDRKQSIRDLAPLLLLTGLTPQFDDTEVCLEVVGDVEGLADLARRRLEYGTRDVHPLNQVSACADAVRAAKRIYMRMGRELPRGEVIDRMQLLTAAGNVDHAMLLSLLVFGGQTPSRYGSSDSAFASNDVES